MRCSCPCTSDYINGAAAGAVGVADLEALPQDVHLAHRELAGVRQRRGNVPETGNIVVILRVALLFFLWKKGGKKKGEKKGWGKNIKK